MDKRKDGKDFDGRKRADGQEAAPPPQPNAQETAAQFERVKNIAEYYQDKGGDALMADIFKSVMAQKNSGALNNKQLENFARKISPMLNDEQKARLNELMTELLKI